MKSVPQSAMFVSDVWKQRVLDGCAQFRARLGGPLEDLELPTPFGRTHLLLAGPPDAPPLVVLHGALTSSAHVMGQLGDLMRSRRVIGVDIVGQSAWSEDRIIDVDGNDYGRWLLAVLDGLQLPAADVVGVSYGAFVGLKAAIVDARRIRRLMLLSPAGIVQGGVLQSLRAVGLPVLAYRFFPSAPRLHRAVSGIFTVPDPDWTAYFGIALRAYRATLRLLPVLPVHDLARVRCRSLILAGEMDASFPGAAVLAHATRWMPDLEVELLRGARHCPPLTPEFRRQMAQRIEDFSQPHTTSL